MSDSEPGDARREIERLELENRRLRTKVKELAESELSQLTGLGSPYLSLVESLGTAVFLYQDNALLYVNAETERISGYTREELLGTPMFDLVHPEDRVKTQERSSKRFTGEDLPERFVARIIAKGGESRWVSFGGQTVEYRGKPAVLGFGTDVTELKQAQAAVVKNETLFRALAETTPVAIFLHQGAEMTYANPAAAHMSGYTRDELMSMGFWSVVHPDYLDLVRERGTARAHGKDPPTPYEIKIVGKSGEERWLEIMGTPLVIDGTLSVLGTGIDITYRRRAEEEMLRTQKLDSLGILAGGIAHDFNNIMTTILGNLSLARNQLRRKKDPASAMDHMLNAEKAVLSARHLTQQLLTFSKGGEPVTEPVDLELVLRETCALALSGSAVDAVYEIPEGLVAVDADLGQVTQVVSNLVINSMQAMPDGGTIRIVARNMDLEPGMFPGLEAGRYVEFRVIDEGLGIPEENISRVFDPYFTTKPGGTGLGLSASYSIVKKHEGLIAMESLEGRGTTVRVILPASENPSRRLETLPPSNTTGTGRILVMDDDDSVRGVAMKLLEDSGFTSVGASDGSEALRLYQESMDPDADTFDAVILDLTVPGGMGGKETISRMRELDGEVKALVSSGYSNDPILSDYHKHGFDGVVAKPYSEEELRRAVFNILSKRAS